MEDAAPTTLRVCAFQGLQNLPIYVARREGYFATQGLSVDLRHTTGSAPQLAGLARGDYDLVQTAPNNVINFDTDPAAFGLDPAVAPRVTMVLGGSIGELGLYARPGITRFEDLRGATLGVDNPTSGFALVLRDLLQRRGLTPDRDYRFAVAGGTHARCQALLDGTIAATILYVPFDLRAAAGGCALLDISSAHYAAYASGATAGAQAWLQARGDIVTRYIYAILRALRWLRDPTHAQAAQALMRAEPSLGVDGDLAPRAYARLVAADVGIREDPTLDDAGLRQVMALRSVYGAMPRPLGAPSDYYDSRWYEQARAMLGHS
jgi:ABC-type nitrate/sulfonate/bicarbonate transport system substrate-binding protein